jgi:hypothetical protein
MTHCGLVIGYQLFGSTRLPLHFISDHILTESLQNVLLLLLLFLLSSLFLLLLWAVEKTRK